jgi:2-phosphosulfolactate phosphatase
MEERKGLNRVEVCFSPCDFHQYEEGFDLIVVIDVLRATSAICTAIENGVKGIIPVSSLEEAREYQKKGYIVAAERNGAVVDGFDLGNSPYSYMNPDLKGETVVLTTTNGTKAIRIAEEKETVLIGSLNNLNALCDWLAKQERDVLVLASGWKDKFNLEDTICGGAITDILIATGKFYSDEDSSVAAKFIYRSAKENMFSYLKASSHRRRLRKLDLNADVSYCLTPNNLTAIPILKEGTLVSLSEIEKQVEA